MVEHDEPVPTGDGLPGSVQQELFVDETLAPIAPDAGFRGPTACAAAGITYRQLDYWARTGLVEPSVRPAHGSGSQRLYGFRDVLELRVVKNLLDAGLSLQNIRTAVGYLRERGTADLAGVTLMSDGTTIYECTTAEDVSDVLRRGQAVFAFAVSPLARELSGRLAHLPTERASEEPSDELAARRRRRTAS